MRRTASLVLGAVFILAGCGSGAAPAPAASSSPAAASQAAAPASKPAGSASAGAAVSKPAAASASGAAIPSAAGGAKDKMTIAYTSFTLDQLAPMVAKDQGFFDKNGIDAEVVSIGAGSRPEAALLSNQVQVVEGGPEEVAASIAGADLEYVAAADTSFLFWLYSIPSVKTAEDLKGKTIAVTSLTSSTYTAAKVAVRSLKLDPAKDVTFIAVNNPPAIAAAMSNGAAQAGSIGSTNIVAAKKAGYNMLVDVASLGVPYPAGWPTVSKKWANSHDDLMNRFMKAYAEGIAAMIRQPDLAQKELAKYSKSDDQDFLKGTYEVVSPHLNKAPYADVKGVQLVLEELSANEPKAKTADPNSFVDNHWVKALEDNGYIASLYK
ncbi:MAG TPA: ABC transporter substrate-binding protein [Chloroflexota bacterium]|nr:ABC transporter substrate-binding protein [Chloroflexota bacterium]